MSLLLSSFDTLQTVPSNSASIEWSLTSIPVVEDVMGGVNTVRYHYDHLVPTRDVSIPEIEADRIWAMIGGSGLNITGEGVIIADLDTGVDWKHPDLWFADGASYDWLDSNPNGYFDAGDAVDLNGDGGPQFNENIGIIDTQENGVYSTEMDWVWVESVADDDVPQLGEWFFVTNDTNHNNILDVGEQLIMLNTPKTRYIVEDDSDDQTGYITWERGVNLTESTHTDEYGHGTAVSSILCGGHPLYRKFTGVAPNAEVIMIKVFGDGLPLYDAIEKAVTLGADVILIEAGQWVECFMDGSSDVERLIDTVSASGVPVIVPSGNLGGSNKHAMFDIVGDSSHTVDFHVSATGTESVWMTALTVDSTNMTQGTFTVSIPTGGDPSHNDVILHPGVGYRNYGHDSDSGTGVQFDSYIDTSSRGTNMLYIEMYKTGGLPLDTPYRLTIAVDDTCTFHTYVQDSISGWSGGTVFQTDVSNNYIITFPATADSVISVASYHTRPAYGTVGAIAGYSGRGPRIDGAIQQGVAAPGGYDIISDYTNQSGWSSWFSGTYGFVSTFAGYRLFSGTSAAGPHVAGCAALMLQANEYCNTTVGDLIKAAAREDSFTGGTPSYIWGYGKLNVSAAVLNALKVKPPTIHSVWRDLDIVEYDDIVHIIANVSQGTYPMSVYLRTGVNDPSMPDYHLMSLDAFENYTYTLNGFTYGETIHYRIEVNDTSGSLVSSPTYSFPILDISSPVLSGLSVSPQPAGIADIVTVHVQASEDIHGSGLAGVYFNYTLNSWESYTTITMTYSAPYYSGSIPGQPYGKTVGYVVYAVDNAGNRVNTSIFYYDIMDDHAPVIGVPVHSPTHPNSTQSVEVSVTVTDESSVSFVILGYFNGSNWNNVSMVYNGTYYTADIPALTNDTHVLYKVYAYDEHGNGAAGSHYGYTVYNEPKNTTTTTTITNSTTITTPIPNTTSPTTNTTLPPDPFMIYVTVGVSISLAVMILIVVVYIRRRQ